MTIKNKDLRNFLDKRINFHYYKARKHKNENFKNSHEFALMHSDKLDTLQEIRNKIFNKYKIKYL